MERWVNYAEDNVLQSHMHPCCTAAMMPRDKDVVDSGLSVCGIPGLRVADCSIIPRHTASPHATY